MHKQDCINRMHKLKTLREINTKNDARKNIIVLNYLQVQDEFSVYYILCIFQDGCYMYIYT